MRGSHTQLRLRFPGVRSPPGPGMRYVRNWEFPLPSLVPEWKNCFFESVTGADEARVSTHREPVEQVVRLRRQLAFLREASESQIPRVRPLDFWSVLLAELGRCSVGDDRQVGGDRLRGSTARVGDLRSGRGQQCLEEGLIHKSTVTSSVESSTAISFPWHPVLYSARSCPPTRDPSLRPPSKLDLNA